MKVKDGQGNYQFSSDGDLKPKSDIPEIDKSLLRLKVSHKNQTWTIAQAIVILLTNGHRVKDDPHGITFANFLEDCNWTEAMAKEKILKFPSEDLNNFACRAFQPNKADLKAIAKEAKRDVKRHLGNYQKGHTDEEEEEEEESEEDSNGAGGPKMKKTQKLTAEEVN